MKELRLQDNPLSTENNQAQGVRQVAIALMPQLKLLNGSEITTRERDNAERMFLSMTVSGTHPELLAAVDADGAHRERLEAKHGEGLVYAEADGNSDANHKAAFAAQLVELTLQPVAGCIIEKPPVKKKLPATLSVGEVKLFCHSVFGKSLPVERTVLRFLDPAQPMGSDFVMDDDARELGFYGVGNGYEIRIDEID